IRFSADFNGPLDAARVDDVNVSADLVTETNTTTVVRQADLDYTSSSPAVVRADGLDKWFMYNDTTDVVDNTLGGFVTGPATAPLGQGSVEFTLGASNARKNIATYQFAGTLLNTIGKMSFSAYSHSGVAGATESPYFNFNVDFTGSNTYQKRLVFVPSANGAVPQDTWNTYDVIRNGTALWNYSGALWPAGATSNGTIAGTTARTWSAILADYPNARVLATDSWVGVRVGEPGPTNYAGDVDKFVIGTISGSTLTTKTFDFEPTIAPDCSTTNTTFDDMSLGSVNGQGTPAWTVTNGSIDQRVVSNTYGFATFGCQTLRMSDSYTTGSFGDQIFSPSITNEAGESDALSDGNSGGTRQNHFVAQFDLASAYPGLQTGMHMSVSPDRGDGSRMSYLRFEDDTDGIHVYFDDVQGQNVGYQAADFEEADIATLNRTQPHTIKFDMTFVDGPSNDIVKIYIDGNLVHTGTSWENYYRFDTESQGYPTVDSSLYNKSRTVDSLLFRESGDADAGNAGKGFLVDNVDVSSASVPGSIHIKKYECTLGTTVVRSQNGVGGIVPAGCTPEDGATFGYVHGTQTDANSPYPELSAPITAGGATSAGGNLTIGSLPATGRYLVVETNGSNQQLAPGDILGLYCQGDGDTSDSNDNQELTFVTPGNTVECVAYNKAAPLPTSVKVTIAKYIGDEPANTENTNSASFPMHAIFPGGEGDYALGPVGANNPDPYKATTSDMPVHSAYSTYETMGEECTEANPWKLDGYSVGTTEEAAAAAEVSDTAPNFTDLISDEFVIVHNSPCTTPPPPICSVDPEAYVSDATTQVDGHAAVAVTPHPAWTASIPGATWIYSDALNGNGSSPTGDKVFTQTFIIAGTPADSTLNIAADNMYTVSVNGHAVDTGTSGSDLNNFDTADSWTIPAADLVTGANTITITVTNPANNPADNTPFNDPNPGGLLYKLTINDTCSGGGSTGPDVKVHIYKYLQDGDSIEAVGDESPLASFPMESSWSAVIGGSSNVGTGTYQLGTYFGGADHKFEADTSPMQAPVIMYQTHEVTGDGEGDVLAADAECVEGKYRLVGYKTSEVSLADAENAPTSPDTPEFDNFDTDSYIIVINENCDDVIVPVEPTPIKVHIFKYLDSGTSVDQVENDADAPIFPMKAVYSIAGLATNLDPGDGYNLGDYGSDTNDNEEHLQYAADTVPLAVGDTYGTHEVVGGDSPVVASVDQCSDGKYYLEGYKVGDTLVGAEGALLSTVSPYFSPVTASKYVIVVNKACPTSNDGGGDTPLDIDLALAKTVSDGTPEQGQTITYTISATDLDTFYTATGVTVNDILPAGVTYVSNSASSGSYDPSTHLWSIGNLLPNTTVTLTITATVNAETAGQTISNSASITEDELDADTANNSATASMTVNTPEAPGDETPPTIDLTATTTDPTSDNPIFVTATFSEPVTNFDVSDVDLSSATISGFTQVSPTVWTFLLTPNGSVISATVQQHKFTDLASNENVVGDSITFNIASGSSNAKTSSHHGGGFVANFVAPSGGEVLGAQTGPDVCSTPLLYTYMRQGQANSSDEVTKLQNFLNGEMGSTLPLTGFFGPQTDAVVKQFQLKYKDEILTPWGLNAPTGWVYKFTQRKINLIYCANLVIPVPKPVID
ncbi:MAG TPA: Ig-like domain-containing protein, partial [Candidatus Paceibacterota bacterium]|nr:Ig-like domain-containing protein [Candidatus Paceibacterota bacterium]